MMIKLNPADLAKLSHEQKDELIRTLWSILAVAEAEEKAKNHAKVGKGTLFEVARKKR
jgi:hypothetical protein